MKVPLSWLKDFVDITIPVDELAHRLTMAGLEVAELHAIGVEGAELPWDREKIIVANILEVRQHPNADMLVLADVDYGSDQPHTVVTGAPNLFPYRDQGRLTHPLKAVFAKEGSQLYDGHKPGKVITTLKGRPVRGVMSDAMLCSEKELGISDEHEGILILEDDAPVGAPLCDVLGDVVFDIDLTPNLARCLSIVGVAREVAAITGVPLRLPDPQVQMDGAPIANRVKVTIDEPDLCPRFTAGLIEGITIAPSPHWMQRRLTYAGMRPINNIVDISNYVMLEWGEPTHAFDADRVQDQHLIVRLSQPGERLTTLDGKERVLVPEDESHVPLLVCDPSGPSALAGVMGGEQSEVSDTTTRVVLEAAIWEARQTRRTARMFKIPSEASRRFERGVDYEIAPIAQRRTLELMRTLAGGTVAQGLIDVYSKPWSSLTLSLPPSEVTRIVGISLTAYDIAQLLQPLGFECVVSGTAQVGDLAGYGAVIGTDDSCVQVTVPSFRQDVSCLADLCEEVARVYGYERIPSTIMCDVLPAADAHPEVELDHRVRDILTGCGLHDSISHSLTSLEIVAKLSPADADASRYLRVKNAVAPERQYLQRSLLPDVLNNMAMNLHERDSVKMFEIGHVFLSEGAQCRAGDDESWLPDEPRMLALAMAGRREPLSWMLANQKGDTGSTSVDMGFFDLKGVVETLLAHLGLLEQASFVPLTDDERFHPGRAAVLMLAKPLNETPRDDAGGKGKKKKKAAPAVEHVQAGVLGELHPAVGDRYEFALSPVVAAEINLDVVFGLVRQIEYRPVSRYPATVQDLAIVADATVPADQVAMLIKRGAGELLESLVLFDIYTGPQIGEGKRSLAYRLSFRARDRTLSDESLVGIRKKIAKVLEHEVGASLRG